MHGYKNSLHNKKLDFNYFFSTLIHSFHIHWFIHSFISNHLGLLQESLIDTCCFGCNALEILKPYDFYSKFGVVGSGRVDLVVPIEGSTDYRKFFTFRYYPLIEQNYIAFIGKTPKNANVDLLSVVFETVFKSMYLMLFAIVMALAAGTAIWVLVSNSMFSMNLL